MRIRVKASVGRLPPTVAEIDRHPREKKVFFEGTSPMTTRMMKRIGWGETRWEDEGEKDKRERGKS